MINSPDLLRVDDAAATHAHSGYGLDGRQAHFSRALLDPKAAVPPGLLGPDGRPSIKRFAVYRNNVVLGLIETLKAAYPAVQRLVGNEFFCAMASLYVMAEPPTSPIMLDYGAGFPAFVGRFEPAAVLPYLEGVARLERAWVEAYHAAEAAALTSSALASVPQYNLPQLRLCLHPSVRIVRSAFPIVEIWRANVDGMDGAPIGLDKGAQDAFVARPDAEVEVRLLPDGAAAFIEALQSGSPVLYALKRALVASPRFNLAGTLRGLFEAGVVIGNDMSPIRPMGVA